MKTLIPLALAALGLLAAPSVAVGFDVPRHVNAVSELEEAQDAAERVGRPLLFVFTRASLAPS